MNICERTTKIKANNQVTSVTHLLSNYSNIHKSSSNSSHNKNKNGRLNGITYSLKPHSEVSILFGTCHVLLTLNNLAILYLQSKLLQTSNGTGLHLY